MRYHLLAALLVSSAISSPALAQEDAPFTGAHVEALGGYDNVEGSDGIVYGVAAGFDFQAGPAILGIEGEYTDSTTKDRTSDFLVARDELRVGSGRDLYAGVRVGFAVAPATMLYAKGGYTNARIRSRYDDGAGLVTRDGRNAEGYRLGAGIEQKSNLFGPSGFVKAEYRYSNYKNLNVGNQNIDIDSDRHQILLGIGARF